MKSVLLIMALILPANLYSQQFLPIKSIVNARDLGGYTMQDGRVLRDRVLLRSAHLAEATDEDLKWLSLIRVTKVIDFRRLEEKKGMFDQPILGAQFVDLPIDASANAMADAPVEEKKKYTEGKKFNVNKVILMAAFSERAQAIARNMYPTLLFNPDCQKAFAKFFRLVLDTEDGAVLYHCTQGKDRTGIASALMLAALGADRETIVADFDATNRVYEKDVKKYTRIVKLFGGKEEEVAVVKAFMGCNTENFVKALDRLDQEYGSLDAYLKGPMGLTDADIQTLRDRYLVERH